MLHGIHHVPVRHLHRPLHWRPLPATVPHDCHREAGAARHAGRLDPLHRHFHRPTAGLEAATVTGTNEPTPTHLKCSSGLKCFLQRNKIVVKICANLCWFGRMTRFVSSLRNPSTPSSLHSGPFTSPWPSSWPCTSAFISLPNAPLRTWRPA